MFNEFEIILSGGFAIGTLLLWLAWLLLMFHYVYESKLARPARRFVRSLFKRGDDKLVYYDEKKTTKEWHAIVRNITTERDDVIKDLVSLNLWSARRLPQVHKKFAYDELDEITRSENERL